MNMKSIHLLDMVKYTINVDTKYTFRSWSPASLLKEHALELYDSSDISSSIGDFV
jgi:hypothetical protein